MPLLAYCITEAAGRISKPAAGIAGKAVEEIGEAGLCCYFSRFDSREEISRVPAVESALVYHQVLQELFRLGPIVPFRFPTVVEGEDNLRQYVQENAQEYKKTLERLRDVVQMEVRLGDTATRNHANQPASGREYLAARQKHAAGLTGAAKRFREATREWVVEWREHQTSRGMRCYALVHRADVSRFKQAAEVLSASLSGARVSGPWPATEFLVTDKGS